MYKSPLIAFILIFAKYINQYGEMSSPYVGIDAGMYMGICGKECLGNKNPARPALKCWFIWQG
jgi:hypothetical protein